MEISSSKMCSMHNAENDFYCVSCDKLICLNCRYSHPKDHMQLIHLAELSANIITQMKQYLEVIKVVVDKEYTEFKSMKNEYDQDKKYLYELIKKVEKEVVSILHNFTASLTNGLQENDIKLGVLDKEINKIKERYNNTDIIFSRISECNTRKDYFQVYQIQEGLKKVESVLNGVDLKHDAIKESITRGQQNPAKSIEIPNIIPAD